MWNLSKMLSALWGILGLATLITLFIIYVNYPEYGNLDMMGIDAIKELDRHGFFLIFATIYLIVNLVIFAGIRAIDSFSRLNNLNKQMQLKMAVAIKTMAIGGNLFLITMMIFVRSIIVSQAITQSWSSIIILLGPVLITLGLVFLLYVSIFSSKAA